MDHLRGWDFTRLPPSSLGWPGSDLASIYGVQDFAFADATPRPVPTHTRSTLAIAAVIHVALIALLIQVATNPVRVSSAGSPQGRIAAYVAGPPAAAPTVKPKPPQPKTALKTEVAKDSPPADQSTSTAVGSAGVVGADQAGSGPVRLGSSGNLTLVRRVQPVYPPVMQRARITGQVVLDAIIHADGTIGEVTVLQSTNAAFAQSAIDAVKRWAYTPIGFEAILTLTVNFTLT
jgi:TonB family protein